MTYNSLSLSLSLSLCLWFLSAGASPNPTATRLLATAMRRVNSKVSFADVGVDITSPQPPKSPLNKGCLKRAASVPNIQDEFHTTFLTDQTSVGAAPSVESPSHEVKLQGWRRHRRTQSDGNLGPLASAARQAEIHADLAAGDVPASLRAIEIKYSSLPPTI